MNIITNQNVKTLEFTKSIEDVNKSAFAVFFTGLKDFILYSQGKKVGLSVEVNGVLKVKIFAESDQDFDAIRLASFDYINNIDLVANDSKPEINIGAVSSSDAKKALIYLQSKIQSLETDLQIQNNDLINEQNRRDYLHSKVLQLTEENTDLQKQNMELQDNLSLLIIKIGKLNSEIKTLKLDKIFSADERLETLLNLLGTLTLVIKEKQETNLTKAIINQISDFESSNSEFFGKIKLPNVSGQIFDVELTFELNNLTLGYMIQELVRKLYRRF
jgi:hypothetical protein